MKRNLSAKTSMLVLVGLMMYACKNTKVVTETAAVASDSMNIVELKKSEYRASRTRKIDILHTKLNLSFNWDSAFAMGEANITLKPYFYSLNTIELDAKQFQIHEIAEIKGDVKKELKYIYDMEDIVITLDREITSDEKIEIYIKYTAMPNKVKVKGSAAISSDKGLYFINNDNSDPKKPRQLWTQGETEANSCWFPTVDSPNEKFTHDIYVTIEDKHTSISNGLKMFSLDNGNGTKTEYWKMDKPNAAYLVMLAIGPFSEYEDRWNDMQVNYYLDSTYLPYAKDIFGNTPEMMTFYSDYLGVKYPWQKYDQVVVHDYVSGAMENTTATIHGSFLHQTKRELQDYDNEDVIAHELFHHWFGDLVTCESWSNLTLNEGFATYGEYLWNEYKYGKEHADIEFENSYYSYMNEAEKKKVDMIRFHYDDKEDMFDSHSYAKGGLILHMLRNYLGDEAFRASLKHYLTKHAYQTVEIHDLRIAFEEVTGQDLNWFFNQWFLASGHPVLEVKSEYLIEDKKTRLIVNQTQDTKTYPLYKLPLEIEYLDGSTLKKLKIELGNLTDTILFDCNSKPGFINFNKGNVVLAEIKFEQSTEELISMYRSAELTVDKTKALDEIALDTVSDLFNFFSEVYTHPHWAVRHYALEYFSSKVEKENSEEARKILFNMANNDKDWRMRYLSIDFLKTFHGETDMLPLCLKGLNDPSVLVESVSLSALIEIDSIKAGEIIRQKESWEYNAIAAAAFTYYGRYGNEMDHEKIIDIIEFVDGYSKYQVVMEYGDYLSRIESDYLLESVPVLKELSLKSKEWWIRMAAIDVVIQMHSRLHDLKAQNKDILEEYSRTKDEAIVQSVSRSLLAYAMIDDLLKQIKKEEARQNLASKVSDYLDSLK